MLSHPTIAPAFLRRSAGLIAAGTVVLSLFAQDNGEPLRATTRPKLEKPPAYDLPPVTSSTTSTRRPSATAASSSSRQGDTSGKVPDPGLFDGSGFPEEERPERGLIAQFEMPGAEQEPTVKVNGPGEEEGAGPGQKSGDGPGSQGGGGGPGGVSIAGLPSLPLGGGGGGGQQPGMPSLPSIDPLGQIAESDMGDRGKPGGESGKPTQPGSGQQGPEGAPPPPPGAQGQPLEKPQAVQIGDPNARLAEANIPRADPSRQMENKPGDERMSVEAASGNQTSNRGSGTERGVDIPSNL